MNILQWLVVVSTVFGLTSGNAISSQCGIKRPEGMIRNGYEVAPHSWPWLAALIFKSEDSDKNGKFFCSGTLVSLKSVITAAHCLQDKYRKIRLNPSDFEVHLGRHNLNDNEELKNVAKVLGPIVIIAMHPDWIPMDYSNLNYDADVALLISEKNIETSPFIFPVCLQNRVIPNVKGTKKGSIVGWGFSSDENTNNEDTPRQAEVEKVSLVDCFLVDNDLVRIASKRTFCVKGVANGASPCKGDSGGGFFVSSGNVWHIEGIVSSGSLNINCPSTKHSLFTKLNSFTTWVRRGINEFYEVQFTYSFNPVTSFGPRHELKIPKILRRGAFLSTIGHSVDLEVEELLCYNQDWGYLPNNIGYMFPNLKTLIAFELKIKSIERLNFKNMARLEELSLSFNSIEHIPSDCFEDLKNLVTIHITKNKLKKIQSGFFIHNPSLEKITLWGNQIQPNELKNLKNTNVEELWLDQNKLESIPFDAFDGLPNLRTIYLNDNNLTTFHKDTFSKNLNLTKLYAARNEIENLSEGLFRNNKQLNNLVLWKNKITEINITFQSPGFYSFGENVCIDKAFSPSNSTELMKMNEELQRQCGKN